MTANFRRALPPRWPRRGCQLSAHFNIAPTDQRFIITSEFDRRKAQCARWDLVNRWARDNLLAKTQYEGVELIKSWIDKDPERLGSLRW
jgi:putative SOS response-associated peptidase YedK